MFVFLLFSFLFLIFLLGATTKVLEWSQNILAQY